MPAPVSSPAPPAFRTSFGPVEVFRSHTEINPVLWEAGFGREAKDGRFYRIAEECLRDQFDFRYLVLRNAETGVAALQPAFLVDQDAAAGLPKPARNAIARFRKIFPRFLRMRLLMVGCAAGEGHLGCPQPWALEALRQVLPAVAREGGASVIVWKDFPAENRAAAGCRPRRRNTAACPACRRRP